MVSGAGGVRIEIEEGLSVRFPQRDMSFVEGVQIGVLAAQMASRPVEFTRTVAASTLPQARAVAEKFGYRIAGSVDAGRERVEVTFTSRRQRPQLRLVSSR